MKHIFCLALSAFLFASWTAAAQSKPNILLILSDDHGYTDLGCQGSPDIVTPHIDSLAKNGIRFTNGYVSNPVCSPSRAGLLTGRNGSRFGIELNPGFCHDLGLPASEKTIAEYLKAAGYTTGLFGKWHLGFKPNLQPTARGFDEFFGFFGGAHSYTDAEGDRDPGNTIQRNGQKVTSISYLTDDLGREAVTFIEKHRDQPWFVYLPFNAPHGPLAAPDKYTRRFPTIEGGRRTFASVVSAMDDAVGAVLAKLRELKLEDNTLIFFISDNGAPNHGETKSSNRPLRGYKAALLEGGIRVPFIIQWKGRLPAGQVDDRPVITLDVLPTVLAAAGVPVSANAKLDGVNLLPYLSGEKSVLPERALCWRYGPQRAVRMGDWKLLHMGRKTQLFNLADDIGEKHDLASEHPAKLKELETVWQLWNSKNRTGKGHHREAPATMEESE
jgi:arylsulfatase A-like enzyme